MTGGRSRGAENDFACLGAVVGFDDLDFLVIGVLSLGLTDPRYSSFKQYLYHFNSSAI